MLKNTILFSCILMIVVGCSPMPKPQYGFTSEYVHKEQDLSKMEVDIEVGNVFSTMYNCNKMSLSKGEIVPVLFS